MSGPIFLLPLPRASNGGAAVVLGLWRLCPRQCPYSLNGTRRPMANATSTQPNAWRLAFAAVKIVFEFPAFACNAPLGPSYIWRPVSRSRRRVTGTRWRSGGGTAAQPSLYFPFAACPRLILHYFPLLPSASLFLLPSFAAWPRDSALSFPGANGYMPWTPLLLAFHCQLAETLPPWRRVWSRDVIRLSARRAPEFSGQFTASRTQFSASIQ
ncbi:hypothetical protein B0H17DRAFT_561714 [Mycena rosella]|uniref:Uncharacterized protein n=1 Tax=Mycena rosella TaxID=1033263 RepID=A0AAD7GJ39_MYCRO|nr:hypothetical protein B0H17DRAFT_561714 [Mycena rosella]